MATKKTMKTSDFVEFDTLVGFGEKVKAYWEENARQLIAVALIICLAAGAVAYWAISSRTAEQSAQALLNTALTTITTSAAPAEDEDQTAALSAAITALNTAVADYGRTEAGRAALFYRAQYKYQQKDYNAAITDYTAFLQHSGPMAEQLRPFALENLGYTHEALGNTAEALIWFEKAVQSGHNAALIGMARMYEATGSAERACTHYRKYLDKQPDTGYREFVEIKIESLCSSS